MNRDIIKEVARGEKLSQDHRQISLSVIEYFHLYENYKKPFSFLLKTPDDYEKMNFLISEAGYRAITQAYHAGLSVGYRNGKKAAKKKMAQTSKNN